MTEVAGLVRRLRACRRSGEALRAETADAKLWYLALSTIVARSALADAAYAAPLLAAAFPASLYLARLAMLLAAMPPPADDAAFAGFAQDEEAGVQLVRREGATTLLLAFCGRHGGLGLPIAIAHRWFGPLGAHVGYLRDPLAQGFVTGIPLLGPDRAGTVARLRQLAAEVGATRVTCYGNSAGGYAAMLYGLELGAHAVLAVNAVDAAGTDGMAGRVGARLHARFGPDLRPLYETAPAPPLLHLAYGADQPDDRAAALRMAGLPGVTLHAVAASHGHDAHVALIERGGFGPLLEVLR